MRSWLDVVSLGWLRFDRTTIRHVLYGIIAGLTLSITSTSFALEYQKRKKEHIARQYKPRPIELRSDEIIKGVTGLIGNTPLVRINSLSDALGVEILGKAEFLNPGGSVKDRVALKIIDDAEKQGLLHPHTGSRIFEGTVGSTAIIMPDDVAEEKVKTLLALGAQVERVRPASIVDKKQNLAKQRAMSFGVEDSLSDHAANPRSHLLPTPSSTKPRGFFADQFENRSNFEAHFEGTGPEIWRQTNGRVSAFVSGAGTGGTVAGIGQFLKSMDEDVRIVLADPEGSGLYNKVKHGVMFDRREAEGTKRRHQVDTVVEGIGINRLTKNMELALPILSDAFRITDAEAVSMSRYLVEHDGLFLGSSSACNLVACVKLVKKMAWRDGQSVVTILCDSGNRHYSKFWNDDYLQRAGTPIDMHIIEDLLSP
ncbi:hypothetical protein POSPLADRAFT_1043395 [Postia placenta MAD-698-R-SB12]|uniref:cysteine synthase n=1 Tax=Postia placenta MAD-698-R-SB12 TaxID=670580 RepID=A0A1X6NBI6_9APHY|nr:hypothetical protein POSPLADRAFT_1043395 [Postia placenta MAD-698-R-SB12]OSX65806.1 hypothetical protein POSPLADRAFT_1043395 [Postia placenta MAD-698-R-SB12]